MNPQQIRRHGHHHANPSIDTHAESTISLTSFPQPPSLPPSLPTTPARSEFDFGRRARPLPSVGPSDASSRANSPAYSRSDWHEGSSSIDVELNDGNASLDRLLPTRFITGLLSDNNARRASFASTSMSQISDITYPPPVRPLVPLRLPRPPPTSFNRIPEDATSDDDTLASQTDLAVIRSASVSRRPGYGPRQVVAIAPARTIRTMSGNLEDRAIYAQERPNSSLPLSPALPSTAGTQQHFFQDQTSSPDTRQSFQSFVPSFVRLFRRKTLPPSPIPETHYREVDTPLPDLAARADKLHRLLEKGYHPHQSLHTHEEDDKENALDDRSWPSRSPSTGTWVAPGFTDYQSKVILRSPPQAQNPTNRKRVLVITIFFVIVALASIGAGVGVAVRKKSGSLPSCPSGLTGEGCNLNATCICTNSGSSRCDALASSLIDLSSTMNQVFSTNYTASGIFRAVWTAQGSPSASECAAQAILVDVPPLSGSPNRTLFAQSALLWNLVQTQDVDSTEALRKFVVGAPWASIGTPDGPADPSTDTSRFTTTAQGFQFNFGRQEVTQPPVAFITQGQPNQDQISRVSQTSRNYLDRMYSFAFASSNQRQGALTTYWTSVLQQRAADLPVFMATIMSSPIVIPFDWRTVQTQFESSAFPPQSCYPLNSSQVDAINTIETTVFGMPPVQTKAKFDQACYADRPLYGFVNMLRLRLPFAESRLSLPTQALILNREAGPRGIIRSGEVLGAFPTEFHDRPAPNPREYGTLSSNGMHHVLLQFFETLPDRALGIAIAQHVLSNPVAPPSNESIIGLSLRSIPPIEVAVFGSIQPADINAISSSFVNPSSSLFFGSTAAGSLRDWGIGKISKSVIWADGSLAPLIARNSDLKDSLFNQIFDEASKAIRNDVDVPISTITTSLSLNGKMSNS